MRLVTIFSVILHVQCQLKLEISSEDIIKPGDDNSSKDLSSVEDDIREMSSLESSQLDFVRRMGRKMLTSTVAPSLKLDPKEPRLRMKPSTEILRKESAKKLEIKDGSQMKNFEKRKRRFKPKIRRTDNHQTRIYKNKTDLASKSDIKKDKNVLKE